MLATGYVLRGQEEEEEEGQGRNERQGRTQEDVHSPRRTPADLEDLLDARADLF